MTPRAQGWLFAVGFSLAVWAALALAVAPAFAQQSQVQTQPLPRATTDASSTVAVTNTFQQIWAAQSAPQGPIRSACSIQNNGTHTMWVFAGALASAVKTSSMVLPPGAIYHCGHNEVVGTSAISLTGTATDAFTASLEGAPTVVPASPAEGGGGVPTDVNLAQVAGATVATGHGTAAGALRVELPTDGTGVVGLAAGTAVIGHVIADTGSTTAVTGNVTVVQPTGTNLHTVLDTTSTTAVTQATAANLNATVVGTGTFAVQGTDTVTGNVASGATDSGNPVKVGGVFNTTLPTVTAAQRVDFQTDANGHLGITPFVSSAALADTRSNSPNQVTGVSSVGAATMPTSVEYPYLFNGTTWDRPRSIITGTDSIGTGIAAAGILAQLDDTSPSTVTENQFGNLRLTPNRSLMVAQPVTQNTATTTRPADTSAYAANDALSDSTSAPTAGGFTLTGACAVSGGNGTINSAIISASAGTLYSGEIWVFNQAVTAVNDNAAFTVSDSDVQNLVAVIPFSTTDVTAANSVSYVTGLNYGYNCVGTANLRYLVKILAAITPASAEVLAVRVQVQN